MRDDGVMLAIGAAATALAVGGARWRGSVNRGEIREVASPLTYHHACPVRRLEWVDGEASPPDPRMTYFAETRREQRRGANGQLLKKPRITVTPGAAAGVVAFLDYHRLPDGSIYIDYMATRPDLRGRGYARALVEALYAAHAEVPMIDWGEIHHEAAVNLYLVFRSRRGPRTIGRMR